MQLMFRLANWSIGLQSKVNTPHGAYDGRCVASLNSYCNSLSQVVVGVWLPSGIHDVSPKVMDESEGLWAKCTEGLHCYCHEVVTRIQMGVLGSLPPLGLTCHCPCLSGSNCTA